MRSNELDTLDKVVSVRLTKADREKLGRWSKAMRMSPADVMRELLSYWFAHKVSITRPSVSDKDLR